MILETKHDLENEHFPGSLLSHILILVTSKVYCKPYASEICFGLILYFVFLFDFLVGWLVWFYKFNLYWLFVDFTSIIFISLIPSYLSTTFPSPSSPRIKFKGRERRGKKAHWGSCSVTHSVTQSFSPYIIIGKCSLSLVCLEVSGFWYINNTDPSLVFLLDTILLSSVIVNL